MRVINSQSIKIFYNFLRPTLKSETRDISDIDKQGSVLNNKIQINQAFVSKYYIIIYLPDSTHSKNAQNRANVLRIKMFD